MLMIDDLANARFDANKNSKYGHGQNIIHDLRPAVISSSLTSYPLLRTYCFLSNMFTGRSLTEYKRELEKNSLDIVYLVPVYTLLQSPVDANGVSARLLNLFYYQITCRLTLKTASTPVVIHKAYLSALYGLDSLLTFSPRFGISTKLLVAQKQI